MMTPLSDRVMVLRDEVLETAEVGDSDPPGAEVFEAIVRAIVVYGETSPGLDHTLHDAIARRLAWGDREDAVLADADQVCRRLVAAASRSFSDPREEMLVVEVAIETACAAARIVGKAALGRAGRERAAKMREELAHRRLRDALTRQETEIKKLEKQASYDF